MANNITKCEYCGGIEFVEGYQGVDAVIRGAKLFAWNAEKVYYVICLECGTICRSYVKNPKRLI